MGFRLACGKIARKKGCTVCEIQQSIIAIGGPQYFGTVAENVRFHDDKSTYTGAHIYRFDSDASADHMTVERHERLRRRSDDCDLGEDGLWVAYKEVFHAFVGKDCDGKEFAKLCRDCSLVDNELSAASCDVIFSGSVAPGKRRMNFDEFKVACGKIAAQK